MKVYHGSDVKIETINLSKCRIGTDFGRGFYVTKFIKDETQATDIFYNSETFAQLADESTELYKHTWQHTCPNFH